MREHLKRLQNDSFIIRKADLTRVREFEMRDKEISLLILGKKYSRRGKASDVLCIMDAK